MRGQQFQRRNAQLYIHCSGWKFRSSSSTINSGRKDPGCKCRGQELFYFSINNLTNNSLKSWIEKRRYLSRSMARLAADTSYQGYQVDRAIGTVMLFHNATFISKDHWIYKHIIRLFPAKVVKLKGRRNVAQVLYARISMDNSTKRTI